MEHLTLSDALVTQYQPLINKITYQYSLKTRLPFDELKSAAYEGFCEACKCFDPARARGEFYKFAAQRIKFSILRDVGALACPMVIPSYGASKMRKSGEYPCKTEINERVCSEPNPEENIDDKFGNVMKILDTALSERDRDFVCSFYGVGGRKKEKIKDISSRWGVSPGLVSQRVKASEQKIRKMYEACY